MPKSMSDYIYAIRTGIIDEFGSSNVTLLYNFLDELTGNKKLNDELMGLVVGYRESVDALKADYAAGKTNKKDYIKKIQSYYQDINTEVVRLTGMYIKDLKKEGVITTGYQEYKAGKKSSFVLSYFIAYLSDVTVSNTPKSFVTSLYESSTEKGATAKEATASTSFPTEEPDELDGPTRAALALLWQTNAGSLAIKGHKSFDLEEVLQEIRNAQSSKVDNNPKWVDIITKVLAKKSGEELFRLMNVYIHEGYQPPTTHFFRGVSDDNYKFLLELSKNNGIYVPDTILATTTEKNTASSFGKVVRIEGDGATIISNRLFSDTMWSGDENEYLFPSDTKFKVINTGNGNLLLREIGMAKSPDKQELLSRETLLQSTVSQLSDIVSQHRDEGASIRYAPQSLFLSEGDDTGICDSLSQAWLSTLNQDNTGSLRNAFLDNVFLRSQRLVDTTATQGHATPTLSPDSQAFLDVLSDFHSSGPRTVQSLDEIVHTLTTASADTALSLQTGNHAMALARRTVNGRVNYYFYDPNLGEVNLPVTGTSEQQASALSSLINDILSMPAGDGTRTLADYYQTVTKNGAYTFTTQTVAASDGVIQPALQALQTLLLSGVTSAGKNDISVEASTPVNATHPAGTDSLSAGLDNLRQSTQSHLSSLLPASALSTISQASLASARLMLEKIKSTLVAGVEEGQGALKITELSVVPAESPSPENVVLKITSEDEDGGIHVSNVTFNKDDILAGIPEHQEPDAFHTFDYAEGQEAFLKSLNVYSALTSLSGLISSIGQGNTEGEVINGVFLASSVSDITGVVDKLADQFASVVGITGTEVFGGGLSGLMGKGLSEGAQLLGLGADAANLAVKMLVDAPILQSAVVGYSIYSDVKALDGTDGSDAYARAAATLGVDTTTGAIALAGSIATMAGSVSSEVAGAVGGIAAAMGILIDVMINPDDPMGLRELVNPGSDQIEAQLKKLSALCASEPQQLYTVRTSTSGSEATANTLSFAVSASDIPEVNNLLNYDLFAPLGQYLAKYSDSVSLHTLEQLNSLIKLTSGDSIFSDSMLSGIRDIDDKVSLIQTELDNLHAVAGDHMYKALVMMRDTWGPLVSSAIVALRKAGVSDDNMLDYVTNPASVLPLSANNGALNVVMNDDGKDFTISWTTPASYDGHVTYANGPEITAPRSVSLSGITDDIIMGIGSSQTLSFDYGAYGDLQLTGWNEGNSPHGLVYLNDGEVGLQSADLDGLQVNVVPYDHHFNVTGNKRDNRFYSLWNDPDQSYEYNVKGEEGDDSLFVGHTGQYIFDGGSDGKIGDRVVSDQTYIPVNNDMIKVDGVDVLSSEYTVYDLNNLSKTVNVGQHRLRQNFSVSLTGVENIVGSINNELIHGNEKSNIISTGGGDDSVWLSGGGDTYLVDSNNENTLSERHPEYALMDSLHFFGQVDRAPSAQKDVIYLSDRNLSQLVALDKKDGNSTKLIWQRENAVLPKEIVLDDTATEQVIFKTKDNALLYCENSKWIVSVPVEDISHIEMNISVKNAISQLILSAISEGNSQNDDAKINYAAFDMAGFITLGTSVFGASGLSKLEMKMSDGVSFHIDITTDLDGRSQTVMVIDNIDRTLFDDYHKGENQCFFGQGGIINMPGIDLVVMDITPFVPQTTADIFMGVGAPVGGHAILQYHSKTLLTQESLSSLGHWSDGGEGYAAIVLPGGNRLMTYDASDIQELVIQDDAQNCIDVVYSDGIASKMLLKTSRHLSDGGVDIASFSALGTSVFGESGLSHLQVQTADGVTFHLDTVTNAGGTSQTIMVIDNIDRAVFYRLSPNLDILFGAKGRGMINLSGISNVIMDITPFVKQDPLESGFELSVGAPEGGHTVLQYHSETLLTAENVSSLSNWAPGGQGTAGILSTRDDDVSILLPDGNRLMTCDASDIQELIIQDDAQNSIDVRYSGGAVSQILFKTSRQFNDGSVDTDGFITLGTSVFGASGLSHLQVQTADGVTFHRGIVTGADGTSQTVLVVDNIDTSRYSASRGGATIGFKDIPENNIVMDITSLAQDSTPLTVDIRQMSVSLTYQSKMAVTPEWLSGLQWVNIGGKGLYQLSMSDGGNISLEGATDDLDKLTLAVGDPSGHNWQMRFSLNADNNMVLTQALDISGQSDQGIVQGELTAFYSGNSTQQSGVAVNLSESVLHGGDVDGEHLTGVMNVMGSMYSDVLTGDSGNNTLFGQGGNDTLEGGGGTDLLIGGAGADGYVIKTGDQVVISAQDNGTTSDTLIFADQAVNALSFIMKDDDLVVSSQDRIAVLKDWGKGDTHYVLSSADGKLDEAQFGSLVQASLSAPQTLSSLSSLYASLGQMNLRESAEIEKMSRPSGEETLTLAPDKWLAKEGTLTVSAGELAVNGSVILTQVTGMTTDVDADYRLTVDADAPDLMLSGFHLKLKAGEQDAGGVSVPVISEGTTRHFELDLDGGTLASLSDADSMLSVELTQDGGHGGTIIHGVQLQKLTGAMAIFGGQEQVGGAAEGLAPLQQVVHPLLARAN